MKIEKRIWSTTAVLSILFSAGAILHCSARVMDPDVKRKPSQQDLRFFTIEKGTKSGIKVEEQTVVRNENEWLTLWRRHKAGNLTAGTAPPIDFDRCMVVAVFQGEGNPDAGLLEIERVKMFSDKIVVYVNESDSHAPNGARSTTCSYHLVRTASSNLPVVFN